MTMSMNGGAARIKTSCPGKVQSGALTLGTLRLPEDIIANVSTRILQRGEYLFYTGDDCVALCLVRSGALKTSNVSGDGDERVMGFQMPGDILGLEAMNDGRHRCCASALEISSVYVISARTFVELWGSDREFQLAILGQMSKMLARNEEMLQTVGHRNAEQRIAFFLARHAEHLSERGWSATEFNLPMSRGDIACYLAMAVETVSRVLTRLQTAGLISTNRNFIKIHNVNALYAMADDAPTRTSAAGIH
jgi:CRP/FNR family transcriptional regulator